MPIAQLDRTVIEISGIGAESFLQGQLTTDVTKANSESLLWTAHCNLKGRMVSLGLLYRNDHGFQYIVPSDIADKAIARLQKFVLFAKVKIEAKDSLVFGCWDEDIKNSLEYTERQSIIISNEAIACSAEQTDWQILEIQQQHAWLTETTIAQFMPSEINLAKLGGVSLNKGCFVGQEVIARLHYLGKTKKELAVFESKQSYSDGKVIEQDGKAIGHVINQTQKSQTLSLVLALLPIAFDANLFA